MPNNTAMARGARKKRMTRVEKSKLIYRIVAGTVAIALIMGVILYAVIEFAM